MGIAFVFAGQGAQYSGMGKDLYDASPAARMIFDMLDNIRPYTSDLCFSGSESELSETVNTQPAMFAIDMACAAALYKAGIYAECTAGFSLGELAAVAYSEILNIPDAFRLVCKRAELMQECAEAVDGGMAAVIKLSNEKVEELAKKFDRIYPVNYSCPGQITVAGINDELELFAAAVAEHGGRLIKLSVSGAFHSPFMAKASEQLFNIIKNDYTLNSPVIPVYSNLTAEPYKKNDDKAVLLAKQVMSPVKWEQTIRNMINGGADIFVEVGAGKTLSGLIKRISKEIIVLNVEKYSDIETVIKELGVQP